MFHKGEKRKDERRAKTKKRGAILKRLQISNETAEKVALIRLIFQLTKPVFQGQDTMKENVSSTKFIPDYNHKYHIYGQLWKPKGHGMTWHEVASRHHDTQSWKEGK